MPLLRPAASQTQCDVTSAAEINDSSFLTFLLLLLKTVELVKASEENIRNQTTHSMHV